MTRDEQLLVHTVEAQMNGLMAYIRNLEAIKSIFSEIIVAEGAIGTPEAMRCQKVKSEIEQQIDSSMKILGELERLRWEVVPLAAPPLLY